MSDLDIDELHEEAMSATGGGTYDFLEMAEQYGSPDSLSSGYLNWDLMLYRNPKTGNWGFPYGRVTGLWGNQETGKTTTALNLSARNIKEGGKHLGERHGGISVILLKEEDYDINYVKKHLKNVGIINKHFDKIRNQFIIKPIETVSDISDFLQDFLGTYDEKAQEIDDKGGNAREELPRIMITVDSFGATMAKDRQNSLEDDFDDDPKRAAKASALHDLFKLHLNKIARTGTMFLYTNHTRRNQNPNSYTKYKESNKDALKFYASCVCKLSKGYRREHNQERSHDKHKYKRGWEFQINVDKLRQPTRLNGKTKIDFYENIGLDKTDSIVKGLEMTEVANFTAGKYVIDFEEDHELHEYNGEYSENALRELIYEEFEFRKAAEKEARKRGPRNVQKDVAEQEKAMQ